MKYFIEAITKWNDFSGKSNLKSFWIFFLIYTLTAMPIGFVQSWSGIYHFNAPAI